jgi:probable rRNA maturation factor
VTHHLLHQHLDLQAGKKSRDDGFYIGMITLQVKRNVKLPINKAILIRAAQVTLRLTHASQASDLGMIIGNDAFIQSLNAKYRHVDAPTDVLSFSAGEVDPDTQDMYLGDVVISLPRATEQALLGGHPVSDELQLLVIHGTLHLLGYDHLDENDKQKMQAHQDLILAELGLLLRVTL